MSGQNKYVPGNCCNCNLIRRLDGAVGGIPDENDPFLYTIPANEKMHLIRPGPINHWAIELGLYGVANAWETEIAFVDADDNDKMVATVTRNHNTTTIDTDDYPELDGAVGIFEIQLEAGDTESTFLATGDDATGFQMRLDQSNRSFAASVVFGAQT